MSVPLEFCPICWTNVECSDFGRLKCSCGHGFCLSCLGSWVHIFETPKGLHYTHTPSCPMCRQTINDWDAVRILGRPIKRPPQIEFPPSPREDQLFLDWLAEQGARQCPRCHMWILREHGCNHMSCRCGQQFCYHCGKSQCVGVGDDVSYCVYSDDGWWDFELRWDDSMTQDAGEESEYQFLMDGMKASFGGKNALLWKGNQRSQNQRRQKGEKHSRRRKKRHAQRKLLRIEVAEATLL